MERIDYIREGNFGMASGIFWPKIAKLIKGVIIQVTACIDYCFLLFFLFFFFVISSRVFWHLFETVTPVAPIIILKAKQTIGPHTTPSLLRILFYYYLWGWSMYGLEHERGLHSKYCTWLGCMKMQVSCPNLVRLLLLRYKTSGARLGLQRSRDFQKPKYNQV